MIYLSSEVAFEAVSEILEAGTVLQRAPCPHRPHRHRHGLHRDEDVVSKGSRHGS